MISLSFHGAAGTVTGSKFLIRVNENSYLIDCGMFQGRRDLRVRNWEPLPFNANDLSAIIVTHAHIDHVGYLPRMVRLGYDRTIYATAPTIDIAKISLLDAAHIQEEDAEYRNRKKLTRYEPALPLFTVDDAVATEPLFKPIQFRDWEQVDRNFRFRFHPAGHILGAASVEVELEDGDRTVSILFSGDIGRYALPLVVNPSPPPKTDYLVCESTYGAEMHEPEDPYTMLAKIINDIHETKSVLLIPAFAIGRTQQVTFMINHLIRKKFIKPIQVNIDSPMAVKATDIYRRYQKYHDFAIDEFDDDGDKILYGKNVVLHRKRKSSKMLNKLEGPAIIISASGMMTGGRIMHHLINRLPREDTVLALVGFMAEGTLGRRVMDGERTVYIHKQPVEVRARTATFRGLSGHADYQEILHWLEPVEQPYKTVFVVHGEPDRSAAMAGHLTKERGWKCEIPQMDQTFEL